jgi:short-subunit dehydrogenase
MSPPLSARYRTAFVTGASTGLGAAFVEMLLSEGVQVWGTSRQWKDPAPARAGFHRVSLELGDGVAAERSFTAAEQAAEGFDLVINNAGFGAFGSFAGTDFSIWEEQLRVMLVNTARLSQVALRGMLARKRGALVNISSIAGEFGMPYQAIYNTTKAGLSALNESLMYELKDTGVIVIDFRPGDFRTDFEGSVRRPDQSGVDALQAGRMARVWRNFTAMMRSGPELRRGRSGTVRCGRFFQAVLGPFLARFGTFALKRRIQEKYFGL